MCVDLLDNNMVSLVTLYSEPQLTRTFGSDFNLVVLASIIKFNVCQY